MTTLTLPDRSLLTPFRCDVMDMVIQHGARRGYNISYGSLADYLGRPNMLGHHLAYPLGDVSIWCHKAGLPLLSSIVVSEHTEEPGEGFWTLVGSLYRPWAKPKDRKSFLQNMQDSVYAYWEGR